MAGERVGLLFRGVRSATRGEIRVLAGDAVPEYGDCDLAVGPDPRQEDGELLGIGIHDQVDELLGVGVGVVGQNTGCESTGAARRSARRRRPPADRQGTGRPDVAYRPTRSRAAGFRRATGWRRPARSGASRPRSGSKVASAQAARSRRSRSRSADLTTVQSKPASFCR